MLSSKFTSVSRTINNVFCAYSLCYFILIIYTSQDHGIYAILHPLFIMLLAPILIVVLFYQLQERLYIFNFKNTFFPSFLLFVLISLAILSFGGLLFDMFGDTQGPWTCYWQKEVWWPSHGGECILTLKPRIGALSIVVFLISWFFVSMYPNSKQKWIGYFAGVIFYIINWILVIYAHFMSQETFIFG